MALKAEHELRRELATEDGRRKPSRRSVKMPGKLGYEAMSDSAHMIARRIQLEKIEKRAKRS